MTGVTDNPNLTQPNVYYLLASVVLAMISKSPASVGVVVALVGNSLFFFPGERGAPDTLVGVVLRRDVPRRMALSNVSTIHPSS